VIFTGTISSPADAINDYILDAPYVSMNPSNPDSGADIFDSAYNNQFYGNAYFLAATYPLGRACSGRIIAAAIVFIQEGSSK
jgi:hypothetical protein